MPGFACDPIEHVRVGVIGLGDRGKDVAKRGAPRAKYEFSDEEGWMRLCEQ